MKLSFFICVLALVVATDAGAQPKQSKNPVFEGWYADPEAIIIGNEYWIYPTYSNEYDKQVFLDAFSSQDLVTWKKHEKIVDTGSIKWARRAVWAPAIVEKDHKYYLFFAANDIQSNSEYGGIGVAVSDKPEGPFKDHLGKPLIDKFYNGAQPIDQFVFKDKDGQYYIIYGGWGHCNITRLNDDFTAVLPFDNYTTFKEITPEGYVEGPVMFIKDNKYYFMWSEGGWTGPDYSVAYAVSDKLTGPFKREGKILQQDTMVARGAGHHSVIQHPQSKQWYIVYHRRPLNVTAANHRETCIEYLNFDGKGKIKPVKITMEGVKASTLRD